MTIERKAAIRDEMIGHLEARLGEFWEEHAQQVTTDSWGQDVTFTLSADDVAAATDRILQSARDRLVLVLLNERFLDPERLEGFAESWLKKAQTFLEEQADAVAAEL